MQFFNLSEKSNLSYRNKSFIIIYCIYFSETAKFSVIIVIKYTLPHLFLYKINMYT